MSGMETIKGKFQGLIDGDLRRYVVAEQKLIHGQTQQCQFHPAHAVHAPVVRKAGDGIVQGCAVAPYALHQFPGKAAGINGNAAFFTARKVVRRSAETAAQLFKGAGRREGKAVQNLKSQFAFAAPCCILGLGHGFTTAP